MTSRPTFFVIRGPEEKLTPILESEEWRMLLVRVPYVVEHMQTEMLIAGDEIMRQVERFAKVAPEYALVQRAAGPREGPDDRSLPCAQDSARSIRRG